MSKTEGTFEAEGWRRRKDDTRLWAHVGVSPMRSSSGSLLGFATVIRDMTEKRRAEESLRQAHDELEARVRDRTAELAAANDALHAEVDERIQAEGVLQQQSLVLRSILDSIGDAVIVAEGDGKPLTFNAAARALFGIGDDSLTLEQWLDLEILQIVDPERFIRHDPAEQKTLDPGSSRGTSRRSRAHRPITRIGKGQVAAGERPCASAPDRWKQRGCCRIPRHHRTPRIC